MKIHRTKVVYTVLSAMVMIVALSAIFLFPYMDSTGNMGMAQQPLVLIDDETVMLHDAKLVQLNIFDAGHRDGVVDPYSSGEYVFYVKNITQHSVRFTLTVTDENVAQVPIVYRLKDAAGNYISGSEDEWVTASELQNIDGLVSPEDQTKFFLDWKWETHTDETDTFLGTKTKEGSRYILNFYVQATDIGSRIPSRTGIVVANWVSIIIAFVIILAVLVLSYITLRNRKHSEGA